MSDIRKAILSVIERRRWANETHVGEHQLRDRNVCQRCRLSPATATHLDLVHLATVTTICHRLLLKGRSDGLSRKCSDISE